MPSAAEPGRGKRTNAAYVCRAASRIRTDHAVSTHWGAADSSYCSTPLVRFVPGAHSRLTGMLYAALSARICWLWPAKGTSQIVDSQLSNWRCAQMAKSRGRIMKRSMDDKKEVAGQIYSVCVRSILDEGWVRALGLQPVATHRHYSGPPRTILTLRLTDQAELLGLLNRLHNMSLTVLSVELALPHQVSEEMSARWDEF